MAIFRRDYPRYELAKPVRAHVSMMGSREIYDFLVDNVSENGLWLESDAKGVPFTSATIIQVEMDLPEFGKVCLLGKIVRWGDTSLGVKVVQIEESDLRRMRSFIQSVSSKEGEATQVIDQPGFDES